MSAFVERPNASGVGEPVDLNFDELLARVAGDMDFLRELAELYFENAAVLVESIEKALHTGDADSLAHAAHTMKGMVANFTSDGAVYRAAAQLEKAGRERTLEAAEELFMDLKNQLAAFGPQLRRLVEQE